MLEMKITVTAADLAVAINNLAAALGAADRKAEPATVQTIAPIQNAITPQPTVVPTQITPQPIVPTQTMPQPAVPTQPAPQVPAVPTTAPTYTMDMIANAGVSLLDAGKAQELTNLLAKYGVSNLTALPKERYGEMAIDLRNLGARI